MPVRIVTLLLIAALLGGCAYFGGKKTAKAPTGFDIERMQRADWWQKAEQGDTEAQYQLGLSYCCGFGPGRTQTIARDWLCRAALQGHPGAQFQLGQLFGFRSTTHRPMSLPAYQDYAHFWYSLAATQGNQLADNYRVAIEQDMSAQQLQRSRAWQTKPREAGC